MKLIHTLTLALLAALCTPNLYAQTTKSASPPAAQAKGNEPSAALTPGIVKKIDLANQRITLQHGDIKNLGMPAMTMVFRVKDRSVLSTLKVGDKVRFHAEESDGALLLTRIEKDAP